jgi:hypothetical protein
VLGHEVERDGGLAIRVELGPVERHDDLGARPHDKRNPGGEEMPDIDPGVGEEPIDLLDRVLGIAVLRDRQRPSECAHREPSPDQRPNDRVAQRGHALGVEVVVEDGGDKVLHAAGADGFGSHGPAQ